MQPAIRVEGLSKKYAIGVNSSGGASYQTLRESLTDSFARPWKGVRRLWKRKPSESRRNEFFAALDNVSFEVQPGEVVGIIGRNGAGKSTLLKILSQVVEPSSGRAELRGRIGSLLEVGTGFHPELSGRENIYMNGSILGMTRREINSKFDEIVEFAGIEQFLDTPVKRYSSGMYVRLAFAVAAHLEPEILIVDEVLAVGDLAFQRKCIGQMQAIGRTGRTVLFVSHNMAAVETLCTKSVLLGQGQLIGIGKTRDVVREYQNSVFNSTKEVGLSQIDERQRMRKIFRSITLLDSEGSPTAFVPLGSTMRVRMRLSLPEPVSHPKIGVGIDDLQGLRYLTVHTPISRVEIVELHGECEIECRVPRLPLAPGDYQIKIAISATVEELDAVEKALCFTVVDGEAFDEGRGFHRGLCVAPSIWSVVSN